MSPPPKPSYFKAVSVSTLLFPKEGHVVLPRASKSDPTANPRSEGRATGARPRPQPSEPQTEADVSGASHLHKKGLDPYYLTALGGLRCFTALLLLELQNRLEIQPPPLLYFVQPHLDGTQSAKDSRGLQQLH